MDIRRHAALAMMLAWLAGPVGPLGCAAPEGERMILRPEQAHELGYAYHWARDLALPRNQHIGDVRILGDMIVLVEQPGNTVWGLALRDGRLRWSRVAGITNQPLYSTFRWNEMIFVNSPTRLYGLDARDGEMVLINDLESTVTGGAVLYGDFAIFGGVNGRVFAHDLNRGFYRWAYQMGAQVRTPPVLAGHRVFVTDDSGGYAMLAADDRTLIWRRHTWGPIRAQPAVDDQAVYVASEDGSLYALDIRAGGRDRWVYYAEQPLTQSPGVTRELVLLPKGASSLVALDKSDGRERWRLEQPARLVHERGDGRLLLATNRQLLLVDPATGEVLARTVTPPLETVLVAPDESIIVVAKTGRILRLNPAR